MRIQVINNPLVLICKKIDVIKTCQSNIVELDTTHNDRCLETWKTLGIPSITLHLRDIMSQKMRENSWDVKEIKENRHRLVEIEGRERPEPGAVLLISELWYENVGKYLCCKNPGTQFVVTSGCTGARVLCHQLSTLWRCRARAITQQISYQTDQVFIFYWKYTARSLPATGQCHVTNWWWQAIFYSLVVSSHLLLKAQEADH